MSDGTMLVVIGVILTIISVCLLIGVIICIVNAVRNDGESTDKAITLLIVFSISTFIGGKALKYGYTYMTVEDCIENNYTVYIDNEDVSNDKINIYKYKPDHFSIDDEQKEIHITSE
jgi:flagellar biosynthesis protein FliQ